MHSSAEYYLFADYFVEQDVTLEGRQHQKETPINEPRMSETARRPEEWVSSEQTAGSFHGGKIFVSDLPTGVNHVPLKLPRHLLTRTSKLFENALGDVIGQRLHERSQVGGRAAPCLYHRASRA